jgi:hypothetical protein
MNHDKYILESEYQVILKQKGNKAPISLGLAKLKYISLFNLFTVNPAISFLDANLNPDEFKKLVLTMYKNKNIDFRNTKLMFLVFQFITINTPEKQKI